MRLIKPFLILAAVLVGAPALGAGLSSEEALNAFSSECAQCAAYFGLSLNVSRPKLHKQANGRGCTSQFYRYGSANPSGLPSRGSHSPRLTLTLPEMTGDGLAIENPIP